MRKTLLFTSLLAVAVSSCEKVYPGYQLSKKTIQRLHHLGLLDADERVYEFYTNVPDKAAGAGNFYTTKRLANYWLDSDKRKNQLNSAYYSEIARIDTMYLDKSLTYISYMTVTKKDSSHFRVFVGGKKPIVRSFFEHAIAHWRASK
jgi:hypothetical protein